jgi:hypothetical protein
MKWKDEEGDEFWAPSAKARRRSLALQVNAATGDEYGNVELSKAGTGRILLEMRYDGNLSRGKELAEYLLTWWDQYGPMDKGRPRRSLIDSFAAIRKASGGAYDKRPKRLSKRSAE